MAMAEAWQPERGRMNGEGGGERESPARQCSPNVELATGRGQTSGPDLVGSTPRSRDSW